MKLGCTAILSGPEWTLVHYSDIHYTSTLVQYTQEVANGLLCTTLIPSGLLCTSMIPSGPLCTSMIPSGLLCTLVVSLHQPNSAVFQRPPISSSTPYTCAVRNTALVPALQYIS